MVKPGNPGRIPSPGKLAPTRRMEKGTRTQTLPDRLPFETDGPTTGAHHEYQHCWPLRQPNQTAHFPALAITRVSGLTTNPGAKAFAPHLLKTHECRANNAHHHRWQSRSEAKGLASGAWPGYTSLWSVKLIENFRVLLSNAQKRNRRPLRFTPTLLPILKGSHTNAH